MYIIESKFSEKTIKCLFITNINYYTQDLSDIQSMPTIPENELVCDAIEAKKPKSKRKSTSPRKVRIEYNKINLPNESFKAEIPEH